MRVLFVGAHTDDIEHGAGGLLCKLIKKQFDDITYLCLSRCTDIPRNATILKDQEEVTRFLTANNVAVTMYNFPNRRLAQHAFEIRELLESVKENMKPDLVITHWVKDIHQDHRLVAEESFRVFRNTSVISYECTRSCPEFAANYFVDLTRDEVEAKIELLALYKTQANLYYNKPDVVRALAIMRGVEVGQSFAEGYSIIRLIGSGKCAPLP
jgi:LmbE family N-acetylglucosaminyl deacetylase